MIHLNSVCLLKELGKEKPEQKEKTEETKTETKAEVSKGVKIPVRVEKLVDELMTFNLIEMKAFIETVARKLGIPEGYNILLNLPS